MATKSAFAEAFDTARKQGVSEFNFNGKRYNTRKKGESVNQWEDYISGFKKPANEGGFTYTAGTLNNGKFTPISSNSKLDNIDQVKNYLVNKPTSGTTVTTLNNPLNRDTIRSYRDNGFNNVDEYYTWLGTDAGKNSDQGKIWNNYLSFTAGATNPEEARRQAFDAIIAQANVSGNFGRRDSRRLAEQLQKMNTSSYYEDFLRGFKNTSPETFESVRTYLNNPVKQQQGGKMNEEEQIKQAFAEFCKVNNLQPNEESWAQFQQYLEQAAQQQTQMAKLGAKLNYIKNIKGECPEGTEKYYFKAGGRICSACRGINTAEEGMEIQSKGNKKAISSTVQNYRNSQASATTSVYSMADSKNHEKLASKRAKGKLTPQEEQEYKRLTSKFRNQSKSVQSKYSTDMDKCGGKMKKHFNGGAIDLVKLRSLLNLNK